jgi:hypothetical protein
MYLHVMPSFNIGDSVTLLPPFSTTNTYIILAINGAYFTLFRKGEHKNLIIYFKCISQAGQFFSQQSS